MQPDEEHLPTLAPEPGKTIPIPVMVVSDPTQEPQSNPEPELNPEPAEPESHEPELNPEPPEQENPEPESHPESSEPEQDEPPGRSEPEPETPPVIESLPATSIHIDNVDQSVRAYIKAHKKWQVILFVPCMALWEILTVLVFIKFSQKGYAQNNSYGNGHLFGGLIGFPFLLASAEYYRIKKQFEAAFLQQFATSNNFSFNASGQLDEAYGTIFRFNGKQTVSDIVTGEYNGASLRIFLYELQIGKQHFADTVVELDVHGKLPNLMLVSRGSRYNQVDLAGTFKKNSGAETAVNLEGNFNDYFTLYCSEQNELEAREVFTPDVMELAETESKQYSVETVNNRIYIYANHFISKTDELNDMFTLAKKLIDKLSPLAGRIADDSSLTLPPVNSIKVHKRHPLLDKILTSAFVAMTVGGLGFIFYLALLGKPAAPQMTGQSLNTPYSEAISQASNLDATSTFQANNGHQIVAAGQNALSNSKNSKEREYSNYWIGDGYFWEGNNAKAVQYEQTAISLNSADPYPYVLEGNILVDEQQNAEALTDANQALHLNPNLATAYRLKAIVLANLGQKQQAIQAINQATILDEGPNKSQFKAGDLSFYTYINNTAPPLYISP